MYYGNTYSLIHCLNDLQENSFIKEYSVEKDFVKVNFDKEILLFLTKNIEFNNIENQYLEASYVLIHNIGNYLTKTKYKFIKENKNEVIIALYPLHGVKNK